MAVGDYFLAPTGLLALSALAVLVALYLISRRPSRVVLPTLQFLGRDPKRAGDRPRLRTLRRSLLFLIQALVLLWCGLAVASPYLPGGAVGGGEAALVVDASASMATVTDGGTRFSAAVSAARSDVAATTTVVVAGGTTRVASDAGPDAAARTALDSLGASDAPGDLAGAITRAVATADEGATVHVYSDFVDGTDWQGAVQRARAAGHRVVLHRVDGGGSDNVGIVDLAFGRTTVTATVENTGEQAAQRTLAFGGQTRTLSLQPGDLTTETFEVPAGGGEIALSPRDSFPVDDVAPVAAPAEATVDVLVLTSDRNRFLLTALEVAGGIDLRVETLPAPVTGEFDVVVFDGVAPDRLLAGNIALARETLQRGGGVVITAQRNLAAVDYEGLLPVSPAGVADSGTDPVVAEDPLTAGLSFPPPGEHVGATLERGRALVSTPQGTPLVATDNREGGQLLYYGYLDEDGFPFDTGYPVFWRRAVQYAAGRPGLASLNRRTGDRLTFDTPTRVETPAGPVTATTLALESTGFYETGGRRLGAALLDPTESAVTATPSLPGNDSGGVVAPAEGPRSGDPVSLVPVAAVLALLAVLAELAVLVRRGDL